LMVDASKRNVREAEPIRVCYKLSLQNKMRLPGISLTISLVNGTRYV
jgi:hypothetical protein